MTGIGTRLTIWYALGATISFAILSVLGGLLLQSQLLRSLDDLNATEFRQLKSHIGSDYSQVSPEVLEARLKTVDQYQSVLFYIAIDMPVTHETVFRSKNLQGRELPDVKGLKSYTASAPGLGPVRVREFLLPPYDVTVATSALGLKEGTRAFAFISAGLIVTMLMISIVIGLGFSRIVLRPIRAIRDTAQRIGSDNLAERIPLTKVGDEVDELAALLNSMFDRIEAAFDQMQRFSDEVSHELKTPLSLIRLHAESVVKNAAQPVNVESAVEQIEEIARLNIFIDQMLFLSRADSYAIAFDLQPVDPIDFLKMFAHDAEALAEHSGQRFVLDLRGRGTVRIEASWLRQVLLNLLSNAIGVSPLGGVIRLISVFEGRHWRLVLLDEGPGLSAAECHRIFERFVRVGKVLRGDRGAGLGLSIARSIVTLHGGTIRAEPRVERSGLQIVVELPIDIASIKTVSENASEPAFA